MKNESILSRQILTYMVSLTVIIVSISLLGSYFFYTFLQDYIPGGAAAGNEDNMTAWDWLWISIATITSLLISVFFTVKLSSRIFTPLNSVAYSLKKISQGDLNARAFCANSQLGEVNNLVNDFNEMAEKLQTLDMQRKSWNAAIAHELRTPVTILRGRLQGLVDGVFYPDPVLFNKLLKQTEGLAHLIEDLRVVSSAGGAGYTLSKREVDLKETIMDSLDIFMPEFNRKEFEIIAEIKEHRCLCDPLRINQCLTVLFDNALHYSTSRKIVVKNGLLNKENYILIKDEGPGIPKEFHNFLFQPFQRAKGANDCNPEGCGLGLSVVKAIMLAHGGDVTYVLTQQNHSIFKLTWPNTL
ncbi:ATP-binding protein [Pantoea piersonii]|uniref:ATP-binding protein n=1 Tax=Pantoea piersonii TaxID=2364647 RepID=UPI002FD9E0D6